MNVIIYKSVNTVYYSGFLLFKNLSSDFNSLYGAFILIQAFEGLKVSKND